MTAHIKDTRLSAEELLAFDDEQLDQYLDTNHRYVDVKDPENVTEEFVQRLRARTHQPISQPVDPQQLKAQLLDASTYAVRPSTPSPSLASTVFVSDEEQYELSRQYQIDAYHKLVDSGGRPTHPLEHMEDIVKNPGELREILSFWQEREGDWEVYGGQYGRWLAFQRIQRHARVGRFRYESDFFFAVHEDTWDKFAARYPETVDWPLGFPEYVQSAKERLARNGFTRIFELDLDVAKQDKLTTWIEYLNWEYMRYEDHAYEVKRLQRHHDRAWKKLFDSGVLRSEETQDVLLKYELAFDQSLQRWTEEQSTERAVETARRDIASAEQAAASSRILNAVRAKLHIAEETHGRVRRRNDCINEFASTTERYRGSKRYVERQLLLLRWMVQQVPLIERESRLPNAAKRTQRQSVERVGPAEALIQSKHRDTKSDLEQATLSCKNGRKRRRDQDGHDAPRLKKAKQEDDDQQEPTLPAQPGRQLRSVRSRGGRAHMATRQNGVDNHHPKSAHEKFSRSKLKKPVSG